MQTFKQYFTEADEYWKIGVAKKKDDTPKVVEVVSSKDQVNKARQAHAGKNNFVMVQAASKKDFSDFSNGKTVKWARKLDEKVKGNTSEDKGHWHEIVLDDEGDGKTISTFPKEHPKHQHKINGAEVQSGGSPKHKHNLDKIKS